MHYFTMKMRLYESPLPPDECRKVLQGELLKGYIETSRANYLDRKYITGHVCDSEFLLRISLSYRNASQNYLFGSFDHCNGGSLVKIAIGAHSYIVAGIYIIIVLSAFATIVLAVCNAYLAYCHLPMYINAQMVPFIVIVITLAGHIVGRIVSQEDGKLLEMYITKLLILNALPRIGD